MSDAEGVSQTKRFLIDRRFHFTSATQRTVLALFSRNARDAVSRAARRRFFEGNTLRGAPRAPGT
jgi:hypothetical protein